MIKKHQILPLSEHLIIILLATIWISIQITDGRDTYKRFKRLSPYTLTKQVEQHECKGDGDCINYPHTSCAEDKYDKRRKCLCADYLPPSTGGECKKLQAALRTPCQADIECLQGAECTIRESIDQKTKLCYCREDYIEVNNTCTNGGSFAASGSTVLALGAALTMWIYNRQ